MLCSGNGGLIFGIEGGACFRLLPILTVVDEGTDRNFLSELRNSTDVVGVIVRDQDVVDLLNLCALGDSSDSTGIAEAVVSPSGVDEERLSVGRNEQGSLAALHVHKEDL